MSTPLLTTKLFVPPSGPNLVPRARLIERLDEGLHLGHRLALVSAPAGFGKTTLLGAWIDHSGGPVAWLSLDEQDGEVTRFWTYLITALQTVHPGLGQEALDLLQATQPPPAPALLTPLLNEVAALAQPSSGKGIVLILDDYHVISAPQIHEGMAFLVEHLPRNLHLVISTRVDPLLPVFRLRARGQLTELRSDDLRFTPDEAATFLNSAMGLDLAPEDVEALEARTEGWIVGLQLAALSLQGRADAHQFISEFTGSHHYVLEYLTEEVVRHQREPVQRFLIQTSILDRLCAPLCDAVLGATRDPGSAPPGAGDASRIVPPWSQSRDMLAELERHNLFVVPLDDEHRWYRYHHLFADLLRNLLRKELSAERIRELHRRASEWYEQQGGLDDAIHHALEGQHLEWAASLIEEATRTTLSRGRVTTLVRWAEALPATIVRARPRLRMYQGWAMFLNGQLPRARPLLQEAREVLEAMPPSPEKDGLRGELLAMLATLSVVAQEIPRAIEEAEEALACLPDDDLISQARATRALGVAHGVIGDTHQLIEECSEAQTLALAAGNLFLAAEIISQLASGQILQGRLRGAARSYRKIVGLAGLPSRFPPAGLGYIGLADLSLEWNELDAAEAYLEQGIELCQRGGIRYGLSPAYYTRAMLRQALGDAEGALQAIHQAQELDPEFVVLERAVLLISYQVRLQLLQGDVQAAHRWATGEGVTPKASLENLPVLLREVQQVSLARVLLAQGEPDKVLAIRDPLYTLARAAGRVARVVEISLLEALALQALGRTDAALVPFERCLSLAEPGGYVRLFLEAGSAVVPLLRAAASPDISPGYVGKLLDAFRAGMGEEGREMSPSLSSRVRRRSPALVEPLTQRELEVLHLICDGLSNREIAGRLAVTLNTVKKHSSHIYGKLGVSSRAQAMVRAQESGLC